MNKVNLPVEFNNEVDDVKQSENEFYALAVNRLNKLAEGHADISGAVVNFKQPAREHETSYIYEVKIVLYMMGSDQISATEKHRQFRATLDSALDAVERQFVNAVNNSVTTDREYCYVPIVLTFYAWQLIAYSISTIIIRWMRLNRLLAVYNLCASSFCVVCDSSFCKQG